MCGPWESLGKKEIDNDSRSCYDRSIVTDIFYFTGTGNSLYVARQLADRMPAARLVPIVAALHGATAASGPAAPVSTATPIPTSTADVVGIVFPVHALTIPIVVRKFVRKLRAGGTRYIFAVATREGTLFRGFPVIDRLLRRHGLRLSAGFILRMWNNEARHASYVIPSTEDIVDVEADLAPRLDKIAACVRSRRDHLVPDVDVTNPLPFSPLKNKLVEAIVIGGIKLAEYIGGVQYFYADESCTKCGVCEKVCLSGKITTVEKAPVWRRDVLCYMCFACLNYCPATAVQIKDIPGVKSYTQTNGRYTHPYAEVKDIAAQKRMPAK